MRVAILFAACGLWAAGAHARTEKCDDFIVDSAGRRITVLSNGYPLVMREYRGGKAGDGGYALLFRECSASAGFEIDLKPYVAAAARIRPFG